jgi:hypothetical protein
MSQENDREKMKPEYDIRGGVRGKYFEQYQEMVSTAVVEDAPWLQTQATASQGKHYSESTVWIAVDAAYQTQVPLTGDITKPAAA